MKTLPPFFALSMDVDGTGDWLRGRKSAAMAWRNAKLPLTFLHIGWVKDWRACLHAYRLARGYYGATFRIPASEASTVFKHFIQLRHRRVGKIVWTVTVFVGDDSDACVKVLITSTDWASGLTSS